MRSGLLRVGTSGFRPLLLGGLAVALAVTGCTANPEPAPLPTEGVSSSATTTPTPTPTAPAMPAEARGTSKAAAKAFVRHWIATLNYAGPSGDTRELSRITADECEACKAIIEFIDRVHSSGGDIEGAGWLPKTVTVVTHAGDRAVVDAIVRVNPQTVRESASSGPTTFQGGRRLKTFSLIAVDESWRVARLDQPS